jgi:hypothetical protein
MVQLLVHLQRRLAVEELGHLVVLVLKNKRIKQTQHEKPMQKPKPKQMQRLLKAAMLLAVATQVIVMPVAVGTMAPLAVTLTCPVVAGVLQY